MSGRCSSTPNREKNDASGVFKTGKKYGVTGRSLLLFALRSQNAQTGQY